jgi:hypothetical protein
LTPLNRRAARAVTRAMKRCGRAVYLEVVAQARYARSRERLCVADRGKKILICKKNVEILLHYLEKLVQLAVIGSLDSNELDLDKHARTTV